MAYRTQNLGLIVRLDPPRAAEVILTAWREKGSLRAVAVALGCSPRSLWRWVAHLEQAGLLARPDARAA
jgi:hypothetical protein